MWVVMVGVGGRWVRACVRLCARARARACARVVWARAALGGSARPQATGGAAGALRRSAHGALRVLAGTGSWNARGPGAAGGDPPGRPLAA